MDQYKSKQIIMDQHRSIQIEIDQYRTKEFYGIFGDFYEICILNFMDLKQKLDYLFIITESKLPKFEFRPTFSLVAAFESRRKKATKARTGLNTES